MRRLAAVTEHRSASSPGVQPARRLAARSSPTVNSNQFRYATDPATEPSTVFRPRGRERPLRGRTTLIVTVSPEMTKASTGVWVSRLVSRVGPKSSQKSVSVVRPAVMIFIVRVASVESMLSSVADRGSSDGRADAVRGRRHAVSLPQLT